MTPVLRQDWKAAEPLQLLHSWPLHDLERHFELGCILNSEAISAVEPSAVGALSVHHAGCWECDLSNDSLAWSGGVFDIFGLPRASKITRNEAAAFYSERSRPAMERLRDHAIRENCGFTLDAEICSAIGETRWMRLIAAPVSEAGRVVRLHGLKLIIS
jgi:hypothetical protein